MGKLFRLKQVFLKKERILRSNSSVPHDGLHVQYHMAGPGECFLLGHCKEEKKGDRYPSERCFSEKRKGKCKVYRSSVYQLKKKKKKHEKEW